MRILYIEDEIYLATAVKFNLEKQGFQVDLAHDGETGLDLAVQDIYDVIILDIMLPKCSGSDILSTLAHAENATALPEPKDTNLVKLLRDRIAVVKPRLANKTLVVNFPKKLSAAVNERAFTEIADILLDNAIKYSDQQIEITLSEQTLVIQNDGAGIPQDKLAHIFDRFYQVDKTAEGAGLGLSIAKSLAEQNHWRLTATSEDNQTEFSLKF